MQELFLLHQTIKNISQYCEDRVKPVQVNLFPRNKHLILHCIYISLYCVVFCNNILVCTFVITNDCTSNCWISNLGNHQSYEGTEPTAMLLSPEISSWQWPTWGRLLAELFQSNEQFFSKSMFQNYWIGAIIWVID